MAIRDRLTNEKLTKLFKNNFALATYSIKLAHYYIKSGHEMSADALLLEILKNPHIYETLKEQEELEKNLPE